MTIIASLPSAKKPIATPTTISAPMKGLHTASPITATPDGYALRLNNITCRTDGLWVRDGHSVIQQGLGAPITSLMPAPGNVLAATTLAGAPWQHIKGQNPGVSFTLAVNGNDKMRLYNGITWVLNDLDNVDTARFIVGCWHQSRVWLGCKDELALYYLPVDAFAGEAKKMPIGHVCKKGGSIACIASLLTDGADSMLARLVIVTTQGEVVIFDGVNPASSETWKWAGTWDAPKPVGNRCLTPWGGSLAYLSRKGLFALPQILARPNSEEALNAISEPIWPEFLPALTSGTWQVASSSEREVLVVSGSAGMQFVLSATGGWSTWTDLRATAWLDHQGDLYFGTADGKVCKLGGSSDNGNPITAMIVDRFNRMGSTRVKNAQEIRTLYRACKPYKPQLTLINDYSALPPLLTATALGSEQYFGTFAFGSFEPTAFDFLSISINDTSPAISGLAPGPRVSESYWAWDDITWARMPMNWTRRMTSQIGPWRGIRGHGNALAVVMSLRTREPIVVTGWDLMLTLGGAK